MISNFKNIQNPDWGRLPRVFGLIWHVPGRDIIAKKVGDEEVLTSLAGPWLTLSTAAPITDLEEEATGVMSRFSISFKPKRQ